MAQLNEAYEVLSNPGALLVSFIQQILELTFSIDLLSLLRLWPSFAPVVMTEQNSAPASTPATTPTTQPPGAAAEDSQAVSPPAANRSSSNPADQAVVDLRSSSSFSRRLGRVGRGSSFSSLRAEGEEEGDSSSSLGGVEGTGRVVNRHYCKITPPCGLAFRMRFLHA